MFALLLVAVFLKFLVTSRMTPQGKNDSIFVSFMTRIFNAVFFGILQFHTYRVLNSSSALKWPKSFLSPQLKLKISIGNGKVNDCDTDTYLFLSKRVITGHSTNRRVTSCINNEIDTFCQPQHNRHDIRDIFNPFSLLLIYTLKQRVKS